jgi:hypothetical protein
MTPDQYLKALSQIFRSKELVARARGLVDTSRMLLSRMQFFQRIPEKHRAAKSPPPESN